MFFSGIFVLLCLTSCQTTSRHLFSEPGRDWQAKVGQLQYHGRKTTLIGEVLVRYSKQGDFELTFTKGPGVTLMMISMTQEINAKFPDGKMHVSCFTCHRGEAEPKMAPPAAASAQ